MAKVGFEAGKAFFDVAQQAIDIHLGIVSFRRRECNTGTAYNPTAGEVSSDRKRILFVCTANQRRSKTAEDLYGHDDRYEVKSAGVADFASVPLTLGLLQWADLVFVMEEGDHRQKIKAAFPDARTTIEVLDIEDKWPRGDPELIELLTRRLKRRLGLPQQRAESGIMRESDEEG